MTKAKLEQENAELRNKLAEIYEEGGGLLGVDEDEEENEDTDED